MSGKLRNARGSAEVNMLEDPIQNIESIYCAILQLHFFEKLLVPRENSKIIAYKNLTRNTIQILLNELFCLNQNENQNVLKDYVKENNINFKA